MDRGAWWPTVHGAAKIWTRLSDFTFTSPEDMKEDRKQARVKCIGCHLTVSQTEMQQSYTFTQNEWARRRCNRVTPSLKMSGDKGREIICQTSSDHLFYRPRMTYPNSPLSSGCHRWPSDGPLGSQISISILESKNRGVCPQGQACLWGVKAIRSQASTRTAARAQSVAWGKQQLCCGVEWGRTAWGSCRLWFSFHIVIR